MNSLKIIALTLTIFFCADVSSMPNIVAEKSYSLENYPRLRVKNETNRRLACYVAIDGYKLKFILNAFGMSRWYKATDRRFDHSHFSVWCDYLELHPAYQQ